MLNLSTGVEKLKFGMNYTSNKGNYSVKCSTVLHGPLLCPGGRKDGRSSPSRGFPVHSYPGRDRPAVEPRGPQADLPVWTSFLEKEVYQIQGSQKLV